MGGVSTRGVEHPDSTTIKKIAAASVSIAYRLATHARGVSLAYNSNTRCRNGVSCRICIFSAPFDLILESCLFCLHVCDSTTTLPSFLLDRRDDLRLGELGFEVEPADPADEQPDDEGDQDVAQLRKNHWAPPMHVLYSACRRLVRPASLRPPA